MSESSEANLHSVFKAGFGKDTNKATVLDMQKKYHKIGNKIIALGTNGSM